jgi:capsular exopolysaccharide synthesis family protein
MLLSVGSIFSHFSLQADRHAINSHTKGELRPEVEDVTEISLQQLIGLLLKNKLLLFLSAVLGVVIALAITVFVLKNQYESTVKLYVYVPAAEQQTSSQDLNAINYAQKVVNTYIQMLDTRSFYTKISDAVGLPAYTPAEMQSMIKFSVLDTTEVFQAAVTSEAPEDSLTIAQAIASTAPSVIQEFQETAKLKIVDPPVINSVPVSPNLKLNLAIGLLAGLALAAMFVFLRDMLDTKIKGADELNDKYGLHVLAEVGDINEEERKKARKASAPDFTITQKYMEAYRTARSNLNFSILKKGCKKICIVSSQPREGKTTSSMYLAITLAQQLNAKVLLVDCDLRKPRVYRYFKAQNTPGLTDYLSGQKTLDEIRQETTQENLTLICSGTVPPNPSELLASEAFVEFVGNMEADYDYVIYDTSPLNLVSDALSIVRLMDGVVVSAVKGMSVHPELAKTMEVLKSADAKITGVVLHGVERGKGYGKGYYKEGYGYEYSYGYGYK